MPSPRYVLFKWVGAKKLTDRELGLLGGEVDIQKEHAVVMTMNSNKAPGPNDMNMECYKRLLSVIHKDLLVMIKDFFHIQ